MPSASVLISSTSNFRALAAKHKIVDKSSAIRDFLQDDYPVHLLLRPRRSGKTTLLRMFQAFFERANPAALKERKDLFLNNDLAITHDQSFDNEFGIYPVLYVDLSNVIGDTYKSLKKEFRMQVNAVASDLKNRGLLANLHELDETDRTFLSQILNEELTGRIGARALFRLTRVLHTLHKREVIVLVDEYDTPTSYATQNGCYTKANEFFRKVFSPLLKGNDHLRGALMVGILRVAKAGWLSGLNNLNVYMLGERGKYSTACMFTEAETQLLYKEQTRKLVSRGLNISFTFADLRKWFNGYNSGDGERLYNPWSIARALGENKLGRYWAESGYDRVITTRIHQMLKSDGQFRNQIEGLVMDQRVTIELDQEMTYSSVTAMSRRQLWTLLYSAGYLTKRMVDTQHLHDTGSDMDSSSGTDSVDSSDDDGDSETSSSEDANSTRHGEGSEDSDSSDGSDSLGGDLKYAINVQIPNHEIQSLFRQWLLDHFTDRVKRSSNIKTDCIDMFQNMVSGSMASFAKGFSKLMWQTMPTQFLGCKEFVYQAYICAFITAASQVASSDQGVWEVDVERCAGIGRLDLILYRGEEAVIQEHKRMTLSKKDKKSGYGDSQRERLTREAEKGLRQIEVKGYRARLPDQVTKLREFGIAFLGPYCAIVGHLLKRKPGGQWKIKKSYIAGRNERHRDKLYTVCLTP